MSFKLTCGCEFIEIGEHLIEFTYACSDCRKQLQLAVLTSEISVEEYAKPKGAPSMRRDDPMQTALGFKTKL